MTAALLLAPVEARVLGVLVEKEKTVPDSYPLSLNALVGGCNQKNNRDPLMQLGETEVQSALDALKRRALVIESSGARVTRYEHNMARVLRVPAQAVALLATLLLRGAQTAAELRINSERLHRFADVSSVEAFLEELATRPDEQGGSLVQRLARRPGEREARWVQLLTGPVEDSEAPALTAAAETATLSALQAQVQDLAAQVAELRRELAELRARRPES